MSIQHDPVLVRRLAAELSARAAGRRAASLDRHRELRAAELSFREGPSLLFLLHPGAGHVLEAPPGSLRALAAREEGAGETSGSSAGGTGGGSRAPRGDFGVASRSLDGARVLAAWTPPDERILVLELAGRGGPLRLVAELHTNQWNLLLLEGGAGGEALAAAAWGRGEGTGPGPTGGGPGDGGAAAAPGGWGRIAAALWPREPGDRVLRTGRPYEPPAFPGGPRRWRFAPPSRSEWRDLLGGAPPDRNRGALLREAAWTSSLSADWVLEGDAGEPGGPAQEADPMPGEEPSPGDPTSPDAALQRYLELRRAAGSTGGDGADGGAAAGSGDSAATGSGDSAAAPVPPPAGEAWLLEGPGGLQPYPLALGRDDARRCGSLLEAFRASAEASGRWAPPAPGAGAEGGAGEGAGTDAAGAGGGEGAGAAVPDAETLRLEAALRERLDRLERRASALERELDSGPDPERLREDANLLLARIARVPRGEREVVLEGFGGEERTLELDPSLSPSDNAERLYDEAARRERAAERLPAEIERVRERAAAVEQALERLPETGPGEEAWELAGGRPAPQEARGGGGGAQRLPYHVYRSSGGLEIRVGRGARQNDELTFHHSHTEDIWLHARQVPGAHVILRWGRKDENPPRRDLLEAAVAAAVHSEARHSGTVGVDWTRRKYVRSPRKAPPGVVLPERVQTVFVEPSEAVLAKLRPEG